MDGRPNWTDCDEAGDYVVPNVLSPRDLVSRPDNMDETVPHTCLLNCTLKGLLYVIHAVLLSYFDPYHSIHNFKAICMIWRVSKSD